MDESIDKLLDLQRLLPHEWQARIVSALDIAVRYGGIDGGHHKTWVIDQMVRVLANADYERLIEFAKDGDDGPDSYEWDTGIAP
jgi:hypothetical protein